MPRLCHDVGMFEFCGVMSTHTAGEERHGFALPETSPASLEIGKWGPTGVIVTVPITKEP